MELKRERVWLISEVFYPDTDIATGNIATQIAIKFSEKYEVHVICGPADYERKNKSDDSSFLNENIVIHRSEAFTLDKNNRVKRLIRVLGISFSFLFQGLKIKHNEKVLVISNPAFVTPLYAFLKSIKKFRFILLMHDVFPENLIPAKFVGEGNLLYKLTRYVFRKARRSADKIIVIGRDMKDILTKHFPESRKNDIVVIPNWSDVVDIYPKEYLDNKIVKQLGLQNKIVILFAGNHGILQNLVEFVKIIEKTNNPILHFIFAGGGSEKASLEDYARNKDLKNISFLPAFPRGQTIEILNACHIGLVSLSNHVYGVGVPSKSYNILAAGKPICFIGNTFTEISLFVKENEVGWTFSYDDASSIVDFLNSFSFDSVKEIERMGKEGRKIVKNGYSQESVLKRILEILQ